MSRAMVGRHYLFNLLKYIIGLSLLQYKSSLIVTLIHIIIHLIGGREVNLV